ncbi:unnamed protein product, partial [Scytosiphon promiscuus]
MRIAAHIAQQELPISAFSSQVDLVRDCGGDTFPDRTFENDKGAWELLRALEGVALKQLHEKLEQSEFVGLQIDESTDSSDSSNIFMAVHFEVTKKYCTDGASCMVGKNVGAATLLAKDNPHILCTHCVAHRGSLAAGSTCSAVPLTAETDKLVTEV